MGQLSGDGTTYTSEGQGWYLTFGNSASPCINPTIYTATAGGKEILIESNARYLAVCKSSGNLSLGLVSIFKYPCDSSEDCTGPENYILHGVLMWLSWGVFTIIQIGSKRWFSFSYKVAYWAHVVGGSIISICTLGALIAVLKKLNWKLELINLHRVTGFTFLIMALIVVGFGLTAQFMRYTDTEWNTNLVLFISKFHKFGAWTIIGIGNIVCYIGISAYVGEAATTFVLIFFASAIFLVPVLYFEISLLLPD